MVKGSVAVVVEVLVLVDELVEELLLVLVEELLELLVLVLVEELVSVVGIGVVIAAVVFR